MGNTRKRIGKFTERCQDLFEAGVALAKANAPKDLPGPWRNAVGPLVVEAKEEKGGTPDRPDAEITVTVKVAGKTLFSAQVYVRYSGKEVEHRSERVEKFVPGKWESVLATRPPGLSGSRQATGLSDGEVPGVPVPSPSAVFFTTTSAFRTRLRLGATLKWTRRSFFEPNFAFRMARS